MTLMEWQKTLLDQGELYRVGGAIRDELLGVGVEALEDVDYVVRMIAPAELEKRLRQHGRLELVGKSFGVYKFKPNGDDRVFDIAYPREERSTGVGHRDFDVAWNADLPLEDDLRRRDFTMNAIAEDVSGGGLIDPCGGQADIKTRTLRMIFPLAFEDDPLRILRGIRFAARFGLSVDPATGAAMAANASLLSTLSTERVQEEFTRVLTQCRRPSEAFAMMHDLGVLAVVFPELEDAWGVTQNEYHPDDVFWHSVKSCDAASPDDLLVRWSALLHDLGKVDNKRVIDDEQGGKRVVFYGHEDVSARLAGEVLRRLRYPRSFVDRSVHLVGQHMFRYDPEWTDATVRRFIHRIGTDDLEPLFRLREADCGSRDLKQEIEKLDALRERVAEELEKERALKVADLAIDGRDVMQVLDLSPGAVVGDILQAVLEVVLEDPSQNRRDVLLRFVRDRFG